MDGLFPVVYEWSMVLVKVWHVWGGTSLFVALVPAPLSPSKYETRTPVVGSSPIGSGGISSAFSHTVPASSMQFVQPGPPSHFSEGSTIPLPHVCSSVQMSVHPSDVAWPPSS